MFTHKSKTRLKSVFCCILAVGFLAAFTSCNSIQNAVFTALSGANQKGVPVKQKSGSVNPMSAVTGETDIVLVADFFPTALKLYDILLSQNPDHLGLAQTTGSLHVMYGNAFIQTQAEVLPLDRYDEQNAEYLRAEEHYLRGRDIILAALDVKYPGFKGAILSKDAERVHAAVQKITKNDVPSAYWASAGWLSAFALDPLNDALLVNAKNASILLERACALEPDFNGGAIWDALAAFYKAAPSDFGGDAERAEFCMKESMRISGGKTPGPYVTYAQTFCVPAQDVAGFKEALTKAISFDPNADPDARLVTIITQNRARWLLAHTDDYFLVWD
ncbi:MAG: TRAP transporter TatT component family protein [Treponemataceae bacterium]|nr:MAG: TRAP transporter TatT component family protein [Treponemataceae bacterium]